VRVARRWRSLSVRNDPELDRAEDQKQERRQGDGISTATEPAS
jgi:hypothetical protein